MCPLKTCQRKSAHYDIVCQKVHSKYLQNATPPTITATYKICNLKTYNNVKMCILYTNKKQVNPL